MGMGKLQDIVKVFKSQNKQDVPVAIIQNGTTEQEKVGYGTINTILKVVEEKELSSPSIIVVGEVVRRRVALTSVLNQFKNQPIAI